MHRVKYRTRTALRERLPWALNALVPKGPEDCGQHDWYRSDENSWLCYHCKPGVTHTNPWTPEQEAQLRREAEAVMRSAGIGIKHPEPHRELAL